MNTRVWSSDRFYGGAPIGLEGWIGLVRPDELRIRTRAFLVVLLGWVPLVLLAGLQDFLYGGNSLTSLLLDFGSLARYLVAAPLFVIAESVCFANFDKIILHFRDSGLIAPRDSEQYENIVRSSCRLLTSKVAEVICFIIAYAITAYSIVVLPRNVLISWSYSGSTSTAPSLAGIWHVLVTAPFFVVLLLGWLWRQFSWTRFLWLVSRLDLQLLPTHPDMSGGLMFLSTMTHAYRPIGFACTAIFAGGIANRILHSGSQLMAYRDLMIAVTLFTVLFWVAPLVVFGPVLRHLRAKAMFEYGNLARNIGDVLGQKWLSRRQSIGRDDLEVPDFSTTTDLYAVVGNIYRIGPLPVTFAEVRNLLIFIALPFVPVLLMAVRFKGILDAVLKVVIS